MHSCSDYVTRSGSSNNRKFDIIIVLKTKILLKILHFFHLRNSLMATVYKSWLINVLGLFYGKVNLGRLCI